MFSQLGCGSSSVSGDGTSTATHLSMTQRRLGDTINSNYRSELLLNVSLLPRVHICMFEGKVCQYFIRGYCKFGDRCKFIHPSHVNYQRPTGSFLSGPAAYTPDHNRQVFLPQLPVAPDIPPDLTVGRPVVTPGGKLPGSPPALGLLEQQSNHPDERSPASINPSQMTMPPSLHFPAKPIAWRTAPCKHFVKNKGWCPLGDACN
jgi:hypothetical protein